MMKKSITSDKMLISQSCNIGVITPKLQQDENIIARHLLLKINITSEQTLIGYKYLLSFHLVSQPKLG